MAMLTPQQELEAIALKYAPKVRRAILEAIKLFLTQTTEEVVLRELKRNGLQGLVELANGFGDYFAQSVMPVLYRAWHDSGHLTLNVMPADAFTSPVVFETLPIMAVSSAELHRAQLVQQVTNETKQTIAQAVERSLIAGVSPKSTARDFRAAIGLTIKQEQAVWNYRDMLQALDPEALDRVLRDKRFDGIISRHILTNEQLTEEQINFYVEKYRQRYIKYRAEVIARTESLRAVHMGEFDSIYATYQNNILNPNLKRFWVVRDDDRLRKAHRLIPSMNSDGRYIYENFNTPLGPLRYPTDPLGLPSNVIQCRCTLVYGTKKPILYHDPMNAAAPRDGLSLPNVNSIGAL